ncbi:MAG: hypothetical protein ACR2NL_11540, partial [Acidimicrobiia bacterium]
PRDGGTLDVIIDYAVVQYRDFKVAEYLMGTRADWFLSRGWDRLHATADSEAHRRYLQRMSFVSEGGDGYARVLHGST